MPEFSSDSCLQSEARGCLETVDKAPLGAAPPQSEVTETAYPYTVTSYVEWIITKLHTMWTGWFVQNDFEPPQVYYKIIQQDEAPYVSNCKGDPASVPHDYPNAFYCPSDPYVDLRGTSEDGLIILPVKTLQRMWSGEVLGRKSKQAGDFAAAITVAHEYGHSVQDELAIQWEKYYPGEVQNFTGSNTEAIADCFAGVWMNTAYYDGTLEPGDFEEGVAALNAIGATQPGSSHPTSPQREAALKLGYNTGDPMQCVDAYWK
ncbi:neutral zinc metallopeptidase [Pseudarthrobacter defluvii]|uniref:neutral zinc metallopeptidase n=1 Tax=Pseudarthrobacter defluvii TaxID=410837 RepID=UPI0027D90E66|nr:neutral zinc metallopeptidase [Pseudarthrobacter defluvii]